MLPLQGAAVSNNLFGQQEDIPLSAIQNMMYSLRRRPGSSASRPPRSGPRKRSRASASCCESGTIDLLINEAKQERSENQGRRKRTESASGSYVKQYFDILKEHEECTELFGTLSKLSVSKKQESTFPFDDLPTDCKLKIFSFLTPMERGKVSTVCREWNSLVRSSVLWHCIDFTSFPLCHNPKYGHVCGMICYNRYKIRMKKFLSYLQSNQPVLKRISFAFDIGDYEDRWLDSMEGLLRAARCFDLDFVHMNWKETPVKPFWVEQSAWSQNDYNEFVQRHRRRQRTFVRFFDSFTCNAPNVSKLILPFDWSSRSLEALSRLSKLDTLVLEKYFVFQTLAQCSVDQLFRRLPNLRRLILEVWTPSGKGLILYNMKSAHLQYLDISQCRGFYIGELTMPALKVFKVSRHPWNGPLTCSYSIHIPCLLEVLRAGAPNLEVLNEHTLRPSWKRGVTYPELDTVLNAICSCRKHKSGWCM